MDDASFREFLLRLAGASRDRARLARVLGVSEATAYGWIRLSEQGQFRMDTSVRGDQNKIAKALLIEAGEAVERGVLQMSEVERFIRDQMPETERDEEVKLEVLPDDARRRASLKKGLQYVMGRFDGDTSADELIAAIEAVVAMNKERV